MISILTSPTDEMWSVGKLAANRHPHHTRFGGVGVRCGYKKLNIAGGGISGDVRRLRLKIQAISRPPAKSALMGFG